VRIFPWFALEKSDYLPVLPQALLVDILIYAIYAIILIGRTSHPSATFAILIVREDI